MRIGCVAVNRECSSIYMRCSHCKCLDHVYMCNCKENTFELQWLLFECCIIDHISLRSSLRSSPLFTKPQFKWFAPTYLLYSPLQHLQHHDHFFSPHKVPETINAESLGRSRFKESYCITAFFCECLMLILIKKIRNRIYVIVRMVPYRTVRSTNNDGPQEQQRTAPS